jgi:hypothetical protein
MLLYYLHLSISPSFQTQANRLEYNWKRNCKEKICCTCQMVLFIPEFVHCPCTVPYDNLAYIMWANNKWTLSLCVCVFAILPYLALSDLTETLHDNLTVCLYCSWHICFHFQSARHFADQLGGPSVWAGAAGDSNRAADTSLPRHLPAESARTTRLCRLAAVSLALGCQTTTTSIEWRHVYATWLLCHLAVKRQLL